jgi:hypothetical protein
MMKGTDMQNLSEDQIKRQDFVDNQIYDLVKRLDPSTREIEWDIGRNVPRKPRFACLPTGRQAE